MPRPGPPLPGLVGPAEQDDRERARRGRQVGRAGIGPDEEVGPLEQRGRLGDRQAARSSRGAGREARARSRAAGLRLPPTTTTRQPLSRNRSIRTFHELVRPALGRVAGPEVHGQERRQRRKPVGMQPVRRVGDRLQRSGQGP